MILKALLTLLFLIAGILAGLSGGKKPPAPQPPGYVEADHREAQPVFPKTTDAPQGEPQKTEPPRSYRIEGVGSRERVPVDLPDNSWTVSDDDPPKSSVKLPKELEDLGKKAKEQLDALDEATRNSVKSVLDSINLEELDPDEATIRPKGDGVELKFSIPTD
nr:hypothetical protein [uncultured Dethiosulfovibrio sp.]